MHIGVGSTTMMTRPRIRSLTAALGIVAALAWTSSWADVYTWTDSTGKLNLSNRPPPDDAHVISVYREDPAVHASAEAARAAMRAEEVAALNERVTQLERDLDAASQRPPPAPVVYTLPAPPPAPYPPVVMQTIVVPGTPTYSDCGNPWGNCTYAGDFGFYPGGIVVVSAPASHRFGAMHRSPHAHAAPPSRIPMPVGTLPDPVNLFPGHRGR
jgi:hypothetical protein